MATRNGAVPQVIDPDVVATMIRDLQIEGRVGVLNVSDVLVPTYLVAQGQTLDFTVLEPFYAAGEVFTAGELAAPAAGTVCADTGALTAGVYDLIVQMGCFLAVDFRIQHRDAANAANINQWIAGINPAGQTQLRFSLQIGAGERLRALNNAAVAAATQVNIMARLRT